MTNTIEYYEYLLFTAVFFITLGPDIYGTQKLNILILLLLGNYIVIMKETLVNSSDVISLNPNGINNLNQTKLS